MNRTALELTSKNILLILGLGVVFMLAISFFLPAGTGWLGWTIAFAVGSALGIGLWAIYRHASVAKPSATHVRTPQQRRAVDEWYRNHNEQPIAREEIFRARHPQAASD